MLARERTPDAYSWFFTIGRAGFDQNRVRMTQAAPYPKRIVVVHAGGMGDLVLAESLFASLREREPAARIELVCRDRIAHVATLYARPPDAIVAIPFDPYQWDQPSDLAAAGINALAQRVGGGVDQLISAELQPTPLGECLAAVLGIDDVLIGHRSGHDGSWDVHLLLRKLGVRANASIRRIHLDTREHELDRYARLAASARREPNLAALDVDETATRKLVVFPFASSDLQQWPPERMVAAATRIAERDGLAIELIGSRDQHAALVAFAERFPCEIAIRSGLSADVPAIARAIRSAFGYLSVDTGLAHLAAAYGVPGVTVYGGGTWPAYTPWAAHSAGVVALLPCFRCDGDCAFGRAFCVEGVDVETVVDAFATVSARTGSGPMVVNVDAYRPREHAILAAAAARYRDAQTDRSARLGVIRRLQDILRRTGVRAAEKQRRTRADLARLGASIHAAVRSLNG